MGSPKIPPFHLDIVCNGKQGKQTYIKGRAEHDFTIFDANEIDRTEFRFSFDKKLLGKDGTHVNQLQSKAEKLMQDFDLKGEIVINGVYSTHEML